MNSYIKYTLIFIISFIAGLYFLDLIFSNKNSSTKNKTDPIHEYTKLPSDIVEINGKKVKVFSGVSNISAAELIANMKEDITSNSALKLIHENKEGNRFYLSYLENGITISVVVSSQSDESCNYQVFKADELLTGEESNLQKDFPSMPDAVSILTLKGKGDKKFYSYTTQFNQAQIFDFYRKELNKTGYREEKVDLPENLQIKEIESNEIYFIKDRKTLTISVSTDPAGKGMLVTISS